jgi:hypothetical protein
MEKYSNKKKLCMVIYVILLILAIWFTVIALKNYSSADVANSMYPHLVIFLHRPWGRVLLAILWFMIGYMTGCHRAHMLMAK